MTGPVRVRVSRDPDEAVGVRASFAQIAQTALLLAGLALLVGAAIVARTGLPPQLRTANVGASPAELSAIKSNAAVLLEQALAKGGSGIRFEIVQFQTIKARPGGRRIEIPHPVDRNKTIGLTDEYFLSSMERGITTADGFWSVETGGKTWRDDTHGWYPTDSPPGIGLDPQTVQLLPALLRNTTSPVSAEAEKIGSTTLTAMTAVGKVADIPGVVAADGAKFTKLQGPITLAFDATGRLVKIRVSALNLNMTDFDLVVETTIVIFYDDIGSLPEPTPVFTKSDAEVKP